MKIDKEILQLRIKYLKNTIDRKNREIDTLSSEIVLMKQALHTYMLTTA